MLDDDSLSVVFSFLKPFELLPTRLACRQWERIISTEDFWRELLLRAHNLIIASDWNIQITHYGFDIVNRRRILKKLFATAKQAEKKSIIQWHIYFFILVTIGISIICYLIIIPILFPLYLDGKIRITVGVFQLVWIDHVTILSFVACIGIFPVLHFCVYLRYWMTNTYNPLPYSYTLLAIPFFVYSLMNISIPVIIIISKGISSQITGKNVYKAYLQVFSILFNITAILQTLLVTTKLDNVLNTYWVVLFTPIVIIPISVIILSYGVVFFARAGQIHFREDYIHNIVIGNAIMWVSNILINSCIDLMVALSATIGFVHHRTIPEHVHTIVHTMLLR